MATVSKLPEPGVILDLDVEERDDAKEPFVAKVAGRNITLQDPSDIDWRDLAEIEIPADLLRVAMSREDRQHLQSTPMPSWKFNRLMESYYTHYDLDEKIRNAKRQASFGA